MDAKIAEAVARGRTVPCDKDGAEFHFLVNTERPDAGEILEGEASRVENELFVELVGEAMREILPETDVEKILARAKRKGDTKLP